jgi:uncharacterized protein (DUF1800 family)
MSPLHFAGLSALGLFVTCAWAAAQEAPEHTGDQAAVLHVLNRITFGPRPGDVEKVEKTGLHDFIEMQLHPESIDDSKCDAEVAQFELLQMSGGDLANLFYNELKDAQKRQKKLAAEQAAQQQAMAPATSANTAMTEGAGANETSTQQPMQGVEPTPNGNPADANAMQGNNSPMQANPGMAANTPAPETPAEAPNELRKKPGKLVDALAKALKAKTVEAIGEIEEAKLVRAVDSNKQLQEVLVDFWENHFNVDVKKGPDRILEIIEDRDVIRPHIWGKFRDLLEATAKSPAMLHYLDNAGSTVQRTLTPRQQNLRARFLQLMPNVAAALGQSTDPAQQPKTVGGVNENYGREIMELHTIGVNAGYTQQDVQEVARCFTGWTFDRKNGGFVFRPRQHDNGPKTVLGHSIPAGGGMQDGETVMDILCSSPACAHFISKEMCQRFVSDDPPEALVNRVATVFTESGGDLRAVTEAILTSPEFLSPANYDNKIKSPLEFAVSAVRASESTITPRQPAPWATLVPTLEGAAVLGRAKAADRLSHAKRQSINWHVAELGEPLFACTPPTGYGEVSRKWVSPGALIERLNFALALTQQQVSDVTFSAQTLLAGTDLDRPDDVLNRCVATLLNNSISDGTRQVLMKSAVPEAGSGQTVNPNKLIALILGSPEFQRK